MISLYAFWKILAPKSQGLRVVYQAYRYTVTCPVWTPKCFFRFFGSPICASRTFTNFSNNFIENISEGKQSDVNGISVTTQDIAFFLKYKRSSEKKVSNIFPFIASQNNLVSAWFEIKNNFSLFAAKNRLINTKILKNLFLDWFSKSSDNLLNNSYIYKRSRRVKIPGVNNYVCSLIIFSPFDKIIQKAFLRVLEVVFEGFYQWSEVNKKSYDSYLPLKFDPTQQDRFTRNRKYLVKEWIVPSVFEYVSFGFRRNFKAHSVLRHIQLFWYSINWFVLFDIEKIFNNLNYHILVKELNLEVADQKVEDEIWKMVCAKIIYLNIQKKLSLRIGVPQGSVFSFFLFNVFMHRLDKFVVKLKDKNFVLKVPRLNYFKDLKTHKLARNTFYSYLKQKILCVKKRSFENKKFCRYNFKKFFFKLYYVRYAENLLFGFEKSKKEVVLVLNSIRIFLSSNLQLNVTDSYVFHAFSENTFFIGFFLKRCSKIIVSKNKKIEKFQSLRAQILRKHSLEYQKYLKLIESLSQKAIRGFANLSLKKSQHRLSKSEIINFLPIYLKKVLWFQENFKLLNKPFSGALFNKTKKLNFRLEKWLNTCYALVDSPELLEFSKLFGHDVSYQILKSRENLIRILRKAFQINVKKNSAQKLSGRFYFSNITDCSIKSSKNLSKVQVNAPKSVILTILKNKGVVSNNFFPAPCVRLVAQSELSVIDWFSRVARSLLSFYCCADNFYEVKKIVKWQLKYSLFATLAKKHKKSVTWIISEFGQNQPKMIVNNKIVATFPSNSWVNSLTKQFKFSSLDFHDIALLIELSRYQYNLFVFLWNKCDIKFCLFKADYIHYARKLLKIQRGITLLAVGFRTKVSRNSRYTAFNFKSKQIPLCSDCFIKFYKGKFIVSDLGIPEFK